MSSIEVHLAALRNASLDYEVLIARILESLKELDVEDENYSHKVLLLIETLEDYGMSIAEVMQHTLRH